MGIIGTRQNNWIGHIMRGDSLQRKIMVRRMEGMKGRGIPTYELDDRGRIRKTQLKGTTTGDVASVDMWTWKADNLKKLIFHFLPK